MLDILLRRRFDKQFYRSFFSHSHSTNYPELIFKNALMQFKTTGYFCELHPSTSPNIVCLYSWIKDFYAHKKNRENGENGEIDPSLSKKMREKLISNLINNRSKREYFVHIPKSGGTNYILWKEMEIYKTPLKFIIPPIETEAFRNVFLREFSEFLPFLSSGHGNTDQEILDKYDVVSYTKRGEIPRLTSLAKQIFHSKIMQSYYNSVMRYGRIFDTSMFNYSDMGNFIVRHNLLSKSYFPKCDNLTQVELHSVPRVTRKNNTIKLPNSLERKIGITLENQLKSQNVNDLF